MQARTGWQDYNSCSLNSNRWYEREANKVVGREHLSGFIVASVVLIHEIGPGLDNTVVSI